MNPNAARLFLTLVLVSGGCGSEVLEGDPIETSRSGEALSGDQTYGPLPAEADLAEPPAASIFFASDWTEHLSGVLYQGALVTVSVDPSRFPSCGTGGAVLIGLMDEDGVLSEELLDQGEPGGLRWGTVELPSSGEVQLWTWVEGGDGCREYDSDFEQNYRFSLQAWRPARVRFAADWSETVEGALEPGGVLVVDYDWDRLPQCRVVYRGFPGWEILAHLRFDSGEEVPAQSVTRLASMYSSEMSRLLAVFPIPEGAHHAELWFENDQYPPTCRAWDSDFGDNYHFWF